LLAAGHPRSFGAVSGKTGTITEFNTQDGLGWIDLDEGGRVRFGGNALTSCC
jgi:hypothetical protein